jgi:VanZ family protein
MVCLTLALATSFTRSQRPTRNASKSDVILVRVLCMIRVWIVSMIVIQIVSMLVIQNELMIVIPIVSVMHSHCVLE